MANRYGKLANQLSNLAFELIKDGHTVKRKVIDTQFSVGPRHEDADIVSSDFEFDFMIQTTYTENTYTVDGGANAGFDDNGDEITPLLTVRFEIPENPNWQQVSFDLKDVIRHELEHLSQDGANVRPGKQMEDDQQLREMIDAGLLPKYLYFKLDKEVDAMLQGLHFKARKAKKPFREVVDDYLDKQPITQEEKENVLAKWRERSKVLNLSRI